MTFTLFNERVAQQARTGVGFNVISSDLKFWLLDRLSSQATLVANDVETLKEQNISSNSITSLNFDDITNYNFLRGDSYLFFVTNNDTGSLVLLALQLLELLLFDVVVASSDNSDNNNSNKDGNAVNAAHSSILVDTNSKLNNTSNDQNLQDSVLEWLHDESAASSCFSLLNLVHAVFFLAASQFFGCAVDTSLRVDIELLA